MPDQSTWSISQLAEEFDISTRSIRFYEEKGLLNPQRTRGGHRVYGKRDRARLKLILRGKRFGMSLDDISEILGLGAVDMDEAEQIKKAMDYGKHVLTDIEGRMEELRLMQRDLMAIEEKMRDRLAELEGGGPAWAGGKEEDAL